MKKSLLVMLVILTFATSAFAGVSFLTAPSVGEGKIALLGLYATNHNGNIGGMDDMGPNVLDSTSLGVRVEYGLMEGLDLLAAYSMDTLPNIKDIADSGAGKQTAGNTSSLGIKYTCIKDGASVQGMTIPVDVAVALGIETSVATIKAGATPSTLAIASTGIGNSSMILGGIVSKKIDNMMPYGGISLKTLTQNSGRGIASGIGLAINLGMYYGIAANQAVAIEYNTESQAYGDAEFHGKTVKDTKWSESVSGISLGYLYMF